MFHIVFIIFISAFIIQIIYYWGIFARLAFYNKEQKTKNKKQINTNLLTRNKEQGASIKNPIADSHLQPVSVVISAKNEYSNLKQFLPLILEQDYPEFEVVVVNDCSDDETDYLLEDFAKKYKHLKIVTIQNNVNFFSGKKFPLSVGIKSAKNDILLLTDADCKPKSKNWIREMTGKYQITDESSKFKVQNSELQTSNSKPSTAKSKNIEIVLGYGAYEKGKGLLNKLIRYDTLTIAIQYLSFALAGLPYMGVGRNLSYRKNLFYRNKGFISHYSIASGDDDLFINQVAKRKNTTIEISHESHTLSEPKSTFSLWMKQKRRHLTTGKYYKFIHKFLLGLFTISQILFFITFVFLLCIPYQIYIILAFFVFRLASQLVINKKCINKLGENKILLFSLPFEIILSGLNVYLIFSNIVLKNKAKF